MCISNLQGNGSGHNFAAQYCQETSFPVSLVGQKSHGTQVKNFTMNQNGTLIQIIVL